MGHAQALLRPELSGGAEPDVGGLLLRAAAELDDDRIRAAHGLYTQALDAASDPSRRAEALEGLGHIAYRSGRPREAIRLYEESMELLGEGVRERPELGDPVGRSYAALGELEQATLIFEQCLDEARNRGNPERVIRFASLLSYALTDRGRFDEAERAVAEMIEVGKTAGAQFERALVEWAQARLRGEQGRTEEAAEHARTAMELLKGTGHKRLLATTYELIASLSTDLGRPEQALELLREGWPLLIDTATPLQVIHYRIEEARALAATGERDAAAAVAMRVAAQLEGTHPGDAGRAYVLLGEIFNGFGEVVRARQLFEAGITLLKKQGPSRYLASAYRRLAELFEAEYRTEDALAVLQRALAVQERLEPGGEGPAPLG